MNMMSREEFESFLKDSDDSMTIVQVTEGSITGFVYLYLLYQAQEQGIALSEKLLADWKEISLAPELDGVLEPYMVNPPFLSDQTIAQCTKENILNYYSNAFSRISNAFPVTHTDCELYPLIEKLLSLKPEDSFADYYGYSGFANYLSKKKACRSIKWFEPDKTRWLYLKLSHLLKGKDEDEAEHAESLSFNLFKPEAESAAAAGFKFSKIFAFPPFYQKMVNDSSSSNIRIVRNMQRGRTDRTEDFITQVVDSLEDNGLAVLLVSNSLFTRNYSDFHKKLINEKYLTRRINLPAGAVYPNNIISSLLVFEKKEGNTGVLFQDCRSQTIGQLVNGEKILHEVSVTYSEIIDSSYDLNSKRYLDVGKIFWNKTIKKIEPVYNLDIVYNSDFVVKESAPVYENFLHSFQLGSEVQIFRGLQDTSEFTYIDYPSYYLEAYRYLTISDIENNRIKETMRFINIKNPDLEKFVLTDRDIVITKTAAPIKIALADADKKIIPAGNFFVIRINEGSGLNRLYLKAYLESGEGLEKLKIMSSGGSLVSLTKGSLEKMQIPYKSEEEQKDIARKYMELENKICRLERELSDCFNEQKKLI